MNKKIKNDEKILIYGMFQDVINFENNIKQKIKNNEKITYFEYYFINYCFSPTKLLKLLLKENK